MNKATIILGAAFLAVGSLIVGGCGQITGATDGYKYPQPMTQTSAQMDIKSVQNNPHMPASAKAMAIGSIQNALTHNPAAHP